MSLLFPPSFQVQALAEQAADMATSQYIETKSRAADAELLYKAVPALKSVRVACPLVGQAMHGSGAGGKKCTYTIGRATLLYRTIMHLNDHHLADRLWVCDWLDKLGIDLTVKIPERFQVDNDNTQAADQG